MTYWHILRKFKRHELFIDTFDLIRVFSKFFHYFLDLQTHYLPHQSFDTLGKQSIRIVDTLRKNRFKLLRDLCISLTKHWKWKTLKSKIKKPLNVTINVNISTNWHFLYLIVNKPLQAHLKSVKFIVSIMFLMVTLRTFNGQQTVKFK